MMRGIQAVFRKVRFAMEIRQYDPYNKADYFRKQGAKIGEGCWIVPSVLGTEPYLVKIGNHVAVAQGVIFMTHDGGTWIYRDEVADLQAFGPIVIEDNCVIGVNTVLFQNVRIGKNSIVGANSVVISDIPENTIALGVPARPFGSVLKYREKCIESWKIQRPEDCILEPGETWWNSRHFGDNRTKLKRHLLEVFKDVLGK